ncbi:phosphate transporter [Seiridium cupressi]
MAQHNAPTELQDQPASDPQASDRRSKWLRFKLWKDPNLSFRYLVDYNDSERERQITRIVDDGGFKTLVFFVAASGFLASSYSLFATNVIMPALTYSYPPQGRLSGEVDVAINELTYIGSVLGMLIMGHLADRGGRKRWYGVELAILIMATFGVVQASEGFMTRSDDADKTRSMDIYSWIIWWRFLLGFGIGAEYPLSAIITSEWASTQSRGTMLSAVFAMQSVGRLLAFAVNLGAVRIVSVKWGVSEQDPRDSDTAKLVADQVWRWTIGIGIIPASIAILFRLTIPETPRYYAGIMRDLRKAVENTLKVYRGTTVVQDHTPAGADVPTGTTDGDHWYRGAWEYLIGPGKPWKRLANVSVLWAIMDIAWYGLSDGSPTLLSILAYDPANNSTALDFGRHYKRRDYRCSSANKTYWDTDCWDTQMTIYDMLEENSLRSILIVSLASLVGSFGAILIINLFRRKVILTTTFLTLSILFAIAGATLVVAEQAKKSYLPTTVFYSLLQFIFNIGPNPLLFVLPAEIFPTVYRGTFYGIAAASGKVGAIIIGAIINRYNNAEIPEKALAIRLLVFTPLMMISAAMSWYLPDVQDVAKHAGAGQGLGEEASPEDGRTDGPRRAPSVQTGDGQTIPPDQRSNISSDDSVVPEIRQRHSIEPGTKRHFIGRLRNIALEEIAPNPIGNSRRKSGTMARH